MRSHHSNITIRRCRSRQIPPLSYTPGYSYPIPNEYQRGVGIERPRGHTPEVVFVTGRGGAVFHSPEAALTLCRGGYFLCNPRPAPVRGPPALIPWTGPRLLPPIFNGDPSGVWVGRGLERGQGQGMPKKTPCPRPLRGAGRGKGPGARVFRGPVRPVTNSIRKSRHVSVELHLIRTIWRV